MTPSWYDVLDVAPDATTDEIRAAWRAEVADLDPTDRRFAVLNRAAKVLLDPDARAAHDAELAEQAEDDEDAVPEPGDAAAGVAARPAAGRAGGAGGGPGRPAVAAEAAPADGPAAPKEAARGKAVPKKTAQKKPAAKKPAPKKPAGEKPVLTKTTDPAPAGERRPLWVALVAGVLAVLLAALSVWVLTDSTPTAELDDEVGDAQAAAERAIVPVLSYDATDLEAGRSTALSYLTEDFGQDYAEIFDGLIEGNAEEIGARVQATLLASAVVRTDPEVTRVQVLVFVDQQTTNDQLATPRTDSNQVTVTMERVDDEWLVDDLDTGTAG
ncbi:J domain-containing protein [Nocardioides sp. CFH 31398]|uniref:J domain-containing protein n=1 Tax=Nocardioides sp. CFH 31398 TaxID=2919579 RepID=UPI001F068C4B|nr:J domain-containing protein [Nocardioides sp. CFH 31398]MCH1865243.1 J domain-containing protein [Nocardioides sp. CFH 31398]